MFDPVSGVIQRIGMSVLLAHGPDSADHVELVHTRQSPDGHTSARTPT
ncbi:hypothetical protein [Nocardia rhizosphaerihabitans]|nr:hypothetical protein [Nocardia rhizosphaerihabitans]